MKPLTDAVKYCEDCRFFAPEGPTEDAAIKYGRCTKFAPDHNGADHLIARRFAPKMHYASTARQVESMCGIAATAFEPKIAEAAE